VSEACLLTEEDFDLARPIIHELLHSEQLVLEIKGYALKRNVIREEFCPLHELNNATKLADDMI